MRLVEKVVKEVFRWFRLVNIEGNVKEIDDVVEYRINLVLDMLKMNIIKSVFKYVR